MRSGPPPKDIGCDEIIAAKTPRGPDPTIAPAPHVAIGGGNEGTRAAIERAADALSQLRSYRYSVDVIGRDLPTLQASTFDLATEGTLERSTDLAIDAVIGSRMREPDGSAAVSSGGQRYMVGRGFVWGTDNVSGDLEPRREPSTVAAIEALTPEGSAARYVTPFAAGFERVGPERHAGIATQHYRATAKGEAAYAKVLAFKGPLTADLWIASDDAYLVAAKVTGQDSHVDSRTNNEVDDGFLLDFEVTRANDPANVVTLPATPRPDPPRPAEPPVDLLLTYEIVPKDGREPTAEELSALGVTLRVRLDVYDRPIKVDVIGSAQVIVTVCDTTTSDTDRRLITSAGALSVVPLPKDIYGTVTTPGPTPLPPAGSPIDPALTPIAPAGRAGITTAHVDPKTGERGLAFRLGNTESEVFTGYAAEHPNEFVAIVLDGIVQAVIPIDARTAKGNFVFTGDYTEAESRNLASSLYNDPIPFELAPVEDVELPAGAH
jgi:hypothetical protein